MSEVRLTQSIVDKAAETLQSWGNGAVAQMQLLLNNRLKNKSFQSNLAQSMIAKDAVINGETISMEIELNDYYVFVDLGVRGIINSSTKGQPTRTYTSKDFPSGFSFKNYAYNFEMLRSLQNFIARKGIPIRKDNKQSSSNVIADGFQAAKSMAYFIKRKGLDGTLFYSDVFSERNIEQLVRKLESIIGDEFEISLTAELKK